MIENTSTKILYSTDGTNKVFDIPFGFINNEDVVLSVKLPTDTDFTKITENYLVNKAMATVTYPVSGNALVADSSVLIERNTPVTQLESSANLHFTSSDVERGLDKITMIAQEIKNNTDGYATDIKTLRKDNDDLGDQVHNIEAKIPQAASDSNQLVDKASMTSAIAAVQKGVDDNASDIAAVSADLAGKQDALVPGNNITIEGNVISATSGSGLTGVVVLTQTGFSKAARSVSQRVNIGTRTYKFITLELNSADGYWCSPMHSSAGYGNRKGNFATIKVELDAAEFTDNLIIKNGGDTFGYKVTLWY